MSFRPAYSGIDRILKAIEKNVTGFMKDDLHDLWKKAGEYSSMGELITIDRGILIIEAKNSSCLQELAMMKEEIKKNINSALGAEKITNIKFSLGGNR